MEWGQGSDCRSKKSEKTVLSPSVFIEGGEMGRNQQKRLKEAAVEVGEEPGVWGFREQCVNSHAQGGSP